MNCNLHELVLSGDWQKLEELLLAGSDPAELNAEGESLLQVAVRVQNLRIVSLLVDWANPNLGSPLALALVQPKSWTNLQICKEILSAPVDPDQMGEDGERPIHLAVRSGDAELLESLLDAGADPNLPNRSGERALHLAARLKSPLSPLLLSHGADPSLVDSLGNTALHLAATSGDRQLVEGLFGALEAKNNEGKSALDLAIEAGQLEIALSLQAAGASPSTKRWDNDPLHWAVYQQEYAQIEELTTSDPKLLEAKNGQGQTALHLAAQMGDLVAVRLLVEAGADPNGEGEEGCTPLGVAILERHPVAAQLLLTLGADPSKKNSDGDTPLHLAAFTGALELAPPLLVSLDERNKFGERPLFLAISEHHSPLASLLIGHGAAIDAIDEKGSSALEVAIKKGEVDLALSLIERGVGLIPAYNALIRLPFKERDQMREALELCEEGLLRLRWLQKLTAHLFNLDGLVELRRGESDPPSEERLSGGKVRYWAQEVGRCLTLAFPNGEAKPLMNAIALSWLLNSPPQRLFEEWKKGRPILLEVGYQRHSAILLVWRGHYLLCNRGGASRAPLELFQFSPKQLTPQRFSRLAKRTADFIDYSRLLFRWLPKKVNGRKIDLPKLPFEHQRVGNCSMASLMLAVCGFLILSPIVAKSGERVESLIAKATSDFSQFQRITQERALSRLKEASEKGPFLPNASLIAEATEQLN